MNASPPLLSIRSVSKQYRGTRRGLFGRSAPVTVVDDVSLDVASGEVVALVGESGSGKSTIARIAANLLQPTAGHVLLDGILFADASMDPLALRRKVQLIQQDTSGSLDPRMSVGAQLHEIMDIHAQVPRNRRRARAIELFAETGLSGELYQRLPHRLSGGQRQRVVIARALTVDPRLLICDEPVSSLDVGVQAQIVDLLLALRQRRNTALLFITHDLALARRIADRVAVMSAGRIVEIGETAAVLEHPQHEYTRSLVAAALPRRRGRQGSPASGRATAEAAT